MHGKARDYIVQEPLNDVARHTTEIATGRRIYPQQDGRLSTANALSCTGIFFQDGFTPIIRADINFII
jgi:hypothetical protein